MNAPRIALVYNDDSHIAHGNPDELLAVQSTVTTTRTLFETMVALGCQVDLIAVHDSLPDLAARLSALPRGEVLVFHNCDGFNGSNRDAALIVHLYEDLGCKHTGASAAAVELCIDKSRAKQCLLASGVPTPRCQVFEHPGEAFLHSFPAIVKPSVEDGSMGITLGSVVTTPESLQHQVRLIIETYEEPVLVEEFIPGRELAVAMIGNQQKVEVLPIVEDDYSHIANPLERLLTYESKWDSSSPWYNNIPSLVPAPLNPKEKAAVEQAAVAAFRAIGLRDFGRVDIRFDRGIPFVIDINEIPDLAQDAGFWSSARAAGMTYPQFIHRILTEALAREGLL